MKLTGISNVAAVYQGSMRSYAVRADGTFWIWGFGHYQAQPGPAEAGHYNPVGPAEAGQSRPLQPRRAG